MTNNAEQNIEELYENSLKKLEEGTVVEGTIVDIVGDDIFVDLGYKADGIIPREEFSYENETPSSKYKVGDKITAYILKMNNGQGNILLSSKRLQRKKLQEEFEVAVKNGKAVEAKVVDVVKNGVIAETGATRIYIPNGHFAKKTENLEEYRGRNVAVKIIEYNPEKKKIVGSERKLVEELKELKAAQVWATLEVGQALKGTVTQITDYGAFVDIGGVDGLLHISEMSWKLIKHPSELLKVGQVIDVIVIGLDKASKKVSLSCKKAEENPWENLNFQEGDTVRAKIVNMKPFGAFAALDNGLEALIHISNITHTRISRPEDVLEVGQEVEAKVILVDLEKKRIELSMRALEQIGYTDDEE